MPDRSAILPDAAAMPGTARRLAAGRLRATAGRRRPDTPRTARRVRLESAAACRSRAVAARVPARRYCGGSAGSRRHPCTGSRVDGRWRRHTAVHPEGPRRRSRADAPGPGCAPGGGTPVRLRSDRRSTPAPSGRAGPSRRRTARRAARPDAGGPGPTHRPRPADRARAMAPPRRWRRPRRAGRRRWRVWRPAPARSPSTPSAPPATATPSGPIWCSCAARAPARC